MCGRVAPTDRLRYDYDTLRYFYDTVSGTMSPVNKRAMNFRSMRTVDVPHGRNGKHKTIVTRILSDLDHIDAGVAIKVPLAQLTDSKDKVRSALNRATRKAGRKVSTASDEAFLYVWNEEL